MICPKCNQELPDNATFCTDCGTQIREETIEVTENKPSIGMSIASMVLGIVCIVISLNPFMSVISIISAILAVLFGIKGRNNAEITKKGHGMATAGFVLGVIRLSIASLVMIYTLLFTGFLTSLFSQILGLFL